MQCLKCYLCHENKLLGHCHLSLQVLTILLYIKQFVQVPEDVIETVSKKVWVCLFTCLAVRAIHLELAENMSAEEFILCLRRFMARRGVPRQIISDNAQQFKVAKTTLNKAWSNMLMSSDVNDYSVRQGIQ